MTTPLHWERVARAETHPTKLAVLAALSAREPASPSDVAEMTGERLGNVAYHVRALVAAGLLVLDRTEPRRGAVEHYYRLADGVRGGA